MKNNALIFTQDTGNLPYFADYLFHEGWNLLAAGEAADVLKHSKIHFVQEHRLSPKNADNYDSGLVQEIMQSGKAPGKPESENEIKIVCINIIPQYHMIDDFLGNKNCIDLHIIPIIRAAAKNYQNVLVLTDPDDYKEAVIQMKIDDIQDSFRLYLAGKALNLTAAVDAALSDSILRESDNVKFPNYYLPAYEKQFMVRHGMNLHQNACFYCLNESSGLVKNFKKIQGKALNFGIIRNFYAAWKCVSLFIKIIKNPFTVETTDSENYTFATQFTPAAGLVFTVGIKNSSPIGAALGSNVYESYKKTFNCEPEDFESAVLGCSAVIDAYAASEIAKANLRAVIAPDFTKEALQIFSEQKELRLIIASRLLSDLNDSISIDDGLLVQTSDNELFNKWHVVTKTRPTQAQIDAMAFGMMTAMSAKSDCGIVVNDSTAIGIASGHTNKSKAILAALENARECMQKGLTSPDTSAEILVSDSSIPFDERTKQVADFGIKAIIQTGGTKNDEEFINFCNEKGISMVFTGIRHLSF